MTKYNFDLIEDILDLSRGEGDYCVLPHPRSCYGLFNANFNVDIWHYTHFAVEGRVKFEIAGTEFNS